MTRIRSYTTFLAAELARLALEGEGIAAQVTGLDVSWEGGGAGVQLLVPEAAVEQALAILDRP